MDSIACIAFGEPPVTGWVAIYALRDPQSGAIRYIGKSLRPLKRVREHLTYKLKGRTAGWPVYRWLAKCRAAQTLPIPVILDWVAPDEWQAAEQWYIAHARRLGCPLLNLSDGGDGAVGYVHPPEIRQKISMNTRGKKHAKPLYPPKPRPPMGNEQRAQIRVFMTGHIKSEETRKRLSAALKGRSLSPEQRARLAQYARNMTSETRARMSAAAKGRQPSSMSRAAISARFKGVPKPDAQKDKMSEALRAYWQRQHDAGFPPSKGNGKVDAAQVRQIRHLVAEGTTPQAVSALFGIAPLTVRRIAQRQTWKHVV